MQQESKNQNNNKNKNGGSETAEVLIVTKDLREKKITLKIIKPKKKQTNKNQQQ